MSNLTVTALEGTGSNPVQFSVAPQFPTPSAGDADTSASTTAFVSQAIQAATTAILNQAKWRFASNEALPTADQGPIWHDAFNSWMTWQVFSANGASYTGYASNHIGTLFADTQPSPRPGFLASGSLTLSRSAYAALRGWAMHNGLYTSVGAWQAGGIQFADNADGTTFRAFDIRGEFPRFWDNGRGVDAGRIFGSWQADDNKAHTHFLAGSGSRQDLSAVTYLRSATAVAEGGLVNENFEYILQGTPAVPSLGLSGSSGGADAHPRNFPVFPSIKF